MFNVAVDSLNWALKSTLRRGDTDLFQVPMEFGAISHSWDLLRDYLNHVDLDTWRVGPISTTLVPKGKFAFRLGTRLDPIDHLLFTAAVHQAGPDIEQHRVTTESKTAFSYRFSPSEDGTFFGVGGAWDEFQKRSQELSVSPEITHVVVTDIADYYQRVYHHRIENELKAAISDVSLGRCIYKLIDQWGMRGQSFGIPVGSDAARLIAELIINDIDRALLAQDVVFCRYVDDYRMFARSYTEAHTILARLAETLMRTHGLTLNARKSRILTSGDFRDAYLTAPEEQEAASLSSRFKDIVAEIGISDPENWSYDDFPAELQEEIDQINLAEMLEEQLAADRIDVGLVKFSLSRLAQVGTDVVPLLLSRPQDWYEITPAVSKYLIHSLERDGQYAPQIVEVLSNLLTETIPSLLFTYHRSWFSYVLGKAKDESAATALIVNYEQVKGGFGEGEAIVALGNSRADYWVRDQIASWASSGPWAKRALILASQALPKDEQKHWLRGIRSDCDPLELACSSWARADN